MDPRPVSQPSSLPTRKVIAMAVTTWLTGIALAMADRAAASSDWLFWLATNEAKALIPTLIGAIVAYFIKDLDNTPRA